MSVMIGWSAALVVLAWLGGLAPVRTRRPGPRTSMKSPRSWTQPWWEVSTGLLVILCGAALLLDADDIFLGAVGLLPQIAGLLLTLAAAVLSIRGAVELGENFASGLRVWNEQEMVTRGLFSFVRHPIYLGNIVLWIGTGLAMMSWLLLLVGVALILPTFYLMARQEERLMTDRFGRAYGEYQARVPMLLPWPRKRRDGDAETPGEADQERTGVQDQPL